MKIPPFIQNTVLGSRGHGTRLTAAPVREVVLGADGAGPVAVLHAGIAGRAFFLGGGGKLHGAREVSAADDWLNPFVARLTLEKNTLKLHYGWMRKAQNNVAGNFFLLNRKIFPALSITDVSENNSKKQNKKSLVYSNYSFPFKGNSMRFSAISDIFE